MAATSEELQFIIRFRNEADAAIRRAQASLAGLATATVEVASAENIRAAAHARANAALGQVTAGLVRFAVVAAPAILSIKGFGDFETGLISVSKTTGITGSDLDQLGERFRSLSREVPVSTKEFLDLATVAGQLGISSVSDISKFTETVSKMGVATDLAGEEAATTLARILNISEGGVGGVERFASVLVRLGNNAAATESEIAYATKQIVQQASRFGLGADQAAAYGAAVASMGLRAETASTTFGRALNEIDRAAKEGGEGLTAFASVTGLTEEEFQKLAQSSPEQALNTFIKGLGVAIESGGNYLPILDALNLGNAESLKVLGPLATQYEQLAKFQQLAADEGANPTALAKEAARAYESFNNQLKVAVNSVKDFALLFGEKLAAAILPVVQAIADFVNYLIELDEATDGFVSTAAAAIAIAATLAVGLSLLRLAWIALAASVAAALGPITLIVIGITTLIGFMVAFKDKTVETSQGVTTWGDIIATVYGRIKGVFLEITAAFVAFVAKFTSGNGEWLASALRAVEFAQTAFRNYANFMIGLAVSIVDAFTVAFDIIRRIAVTVGQEIADTVIKPIEAIKLAAAGNFEAAGKALLESGVNFIDIAKTANDAFNDGMKDITENFARDYVGEGISAVESIVGSLTAEAKAQIDSILKEAVDRKNGREFNEAGGLSRVEEGGTTVTTDTSVTVGTPDLNLGNNKEQSQELKDAIADVNAEINEYIEAQRLANSLIGLGADAQIEKNALAEFENTAKKAGITLSQDQLTLIEEGIALEQQARQDKAKDDFGSSLDDYIQQQKIEIDQLGLSNIEREIAVQRQEFLNEAKAAEIELGVEELAQLEEALALLGAKLQATEAERAAAREARQEERESLALYGAIAADGEESMKRIRATAVSVAADVQRGFADAFANAIVYSDDLGASLKDLAQKALADLLSGLIQIGIQFLVNKLIGDTIMASITAGSVAQAVLVATAWAPAATAVTLATAGANVVPAITGQTLAYASGKALAAIALADGGLVTGPGSGTSDEIPAWLSNGEFVVNAKSTSEYLPILKMMNENKFAEGGVVGGGGGSSGLSAMLRPTSAAQAPSYAITIAPVVTISRGGSGSGGEGEDRSDKALAKEIVDGIDGKVREILAEELRFGGILGGS